MRLKAISLNNMVYAMDTKLDTIMLVMSEIGKENPIHIEDIAIAAHNLSPKMFGWSSPKYEGYPDKIKIRRTLRHAKARGLVRPNREYWSLTPDGNKFLEAKSIAKPKKINVPRQITHSELYKLYVRRKKSKKKGIVQSDDCRIREMLGVSPDCSVNLLMVEFRRLQDNVIKSGDQDAIQFVDDCGRLLLGESDGKGS